MEITIGSLTSLESLSSEEWLLIGTASQDSELRIRLSPNAVHVLCLLLASAIENNGGELLGEEPMEEGEARH